MNWVPVDPSMAADSEKYVFATTVKEIEALPADTRALCCADLRDDGVAALRRESAKSTADCESSREGLRCGNTCAKRPRAHTTRSGNENSYQSVIDFTIDVRRKPFGGAHLRNAPFA